MRLRDEPPDETAPAPPDSRSETASARLGLWGPLYFLLWLAGVLLAVVTLWWRQPDSLAVQVAAWALTLGVVAWLVCQSRVMIHDLLTTLSDRDRFLLGLLMLTPLVLPVMVRGPRVAPDGFLWATPTVLLLAVTPSLTRRLLALMLLGAWLAALRMEDADPAGLVLLLGFGLVWLMALGATHFAYTGDPHGLAGGWPLRKVLVNAVAAAIPAAVAAVLTWQAWPKPRPLAADPASPLPPPPPKLRLIDRLDPLELEQLLLNVAVIILATLFVFTVVFYLRRWLLRRNARVMTLKLVPGQVAQIEVRVEPPPANKMKYGGMRGRIIQLWGRWAAALERQGEGRAEGETAAAYAARLAAERPDAAPPAAMTALLERVHYGKEEPRPEDFEAMKQFVHGEAEKLKRARARKGKS